LSPPICSLTTVTRGMPFTKMVKKINIPTHTHTHTHMYIGEQMSKKLNKKRSKL
jgi:hypothetical protein